MLAYVRALQALVADPVVVLMSAEAQHKCISHGDYYLH